MIYALLTRAPVVLLPLDLHVLGTPPTFVLSQDQTLRCIYFFCLFQRCVPSFSSA